MTIAKAMSFLLAGALFLSAGSAHADKNKPSDTTSKDKIPDRKSLKAIIGPGLKEPDPIAVAKPFCTASAAVCNEVVEILKADLTLSLFFKVLADKTFIANMNRETLVRTRWKDWVNVGATYLVKSKISGSSGNIKLEFRLSDVSMKKSFNLRTQLQTGLTKGTLRSGVHKFVNELIKAVTGTPGVFGSRIAYSSRTGRESKGVFVISMDGKSRYGVAGKGINMLPSWNGGNVMYTSFLTGTPQIWMGNKQLSRSPGHYYKAAANGSGTIAVAVNRGGQADIFIMKDGQLGKNLTNHPADDISPSWEPSGKRIAFVSSRSGGPQIYVMNADGSGQRRLTMAGNYNTEPSFGPNGQVVFSMQTDGKYDIFTVDMSGSMTRVTQDQGSNRSPTWSPDGRYIAFVSNRGGKTRIWIATADGRFQLPITEKSGGYQSLAWSN